MLNLFTSPKCQIGEFSENRFWRIVSHLFYLLTFDSPTLHEIQWPCRPSTKAATCLTLIPEAGASHGRYLDKTLSLYTVAWKRVTTNNTKTVSQRGIIRNRENTTWAKNFSVITIACGEWCKKTPNYVYSSMFPVDFRYTFVCDALKASSFSMFFLDQLPKSLRFTKSLSAPFQTSNQPATNHK